MFMTINGIIISRANAAEATVGTVAASLSGASWFIHDLVPWVSAVGAFCGTFVAVHACYKIFKDWYHGIRRNS